MVIKVTHLVKKFGKTKALANISFHVARGDIVGFVGANGAGKTTTISSILGFITPTSGDIELFGERVVPASVHRLHKRVGYAAGDMELPARLTGAQYLYFIRRQSSKNHDKLFDSLCERFKPQLDKKIGTLSRGNKQKIALIGAFVTDPDLIILDEPTSGLDPVMQETFLQLVRESQARGKTIFMSSHYLNEVADVCNRVILMREGAVIKDISATELLKGSGKQVRVVVGQKTVTTPKNAVDITKETIEDITRLEFAFRGSVSELQAWAASIKQLRDIEITEYNLESAFKEMYANEEVRK